MTIVSILKKKRDGHALSDAEISQIVDGVTRETIPDYQISAFAMAVFLRSMNDFETTSLTQHMLRSGETIHWSSHGFPVVDKHSTGGVGDKVSLVLAPLLACCGFYVPMISGRGLGATGGTIDKLEAIPGFRADLSLAEIRRITNDVGCVITAASSEIAPADRRLYAIRDVTATVASIPLITSSILSKKLAAGLDALVLDVKFGGGAFMQTPEEAGQLARSLVNTGARLGLRTTALLTNMDQPLGRMIGNGVEVDEAVETLQGCGSEDLRELVVTLGIELMQLVRKDVAETDLRHELLETLDSGRGLEKLSEMVAAQGGDLSQQRRRSKTHWIEADRSGFVRAIDARKIGELVIDLGGGRRKLQDKIDHSVGVELAVKVGDSIDQGQPLAKVFCEAEHKAHAAKVLEDVFEMGEPVDVPKLIRARVVAESRVVPE